MGEDVNCDKCGYYRGHPNKQIDGKWIFICKNCRSGNTDERERILDMTYEELCREDDNDYNERMYGDEEAD